MHATTAMPDVERGRELRGASHDDPSATSNVDVSVVATWPAVAGRCGLIGMAVCTVTGLAEPELMTAPAHPVAAVLLALIQIGLGEHVLHDRPTFGWRTAFVVDLALLPTILAGWVAADYARWVVVVAASVLSPTWLCCAVARCRPEGRNENAVAMRPHVHSAVDGGNR